MRSGYWGITLSFFIAFTTYAASPAKPIHRADWGDVAGALGKSGSVQPGEVYKVSFPRSDLDVSIGDVHVRPALALGSWAAFIQSSHAAMTMGDLVLKESEVSDVIAALQAGGIDQTAIHNHLLGESPRVIYVHFSGHGDAVALARTLHDALAKTQTPMQASSSTAPAVDLPTAELDRIIGTAGKPNGGTVQYSVPRAERIVDHGMEIPPSAGVATAINFQPTGNGRAAVTGDFVLTAGEVNAVIRELGKGGISATALHSHMLTETPRLFFMHFWASADAVKLAMTLRAALDRTNVKRSK